MPRRFARSLSLLRLLCGVLVVCACPACGKKSHSSESSRSAQPDPLTTAIAQALSPVAASGVISSATLLHCSDIEGGLLSLNQKKWSSEEVGALVGELLERGRGLCFASQAAQWDSGRATSLALSMMAPNSAMALLWLRSGPRTAGILRRRSALYFELGKSEKARELLIDSLSLEENSRVRAQTMRLLRLAGQAERALAIGSLISSEESESFELRRERLATLSSLGRYSQVNQLLRASPIDWRHSLAQAAVEEASDLEAFTGLAGTESQVLLAASQVATVNLEGRVQMLRRASAMTDGSAALWRALAEAEDAAGNFSESVTAWDRAAVLSPGAERPVLAPIRILLGMGQKGQAEARALKLAELAREENNSDLLRLASLAARYAKLTSAAVSLAQEALALRPGEGRLVSELADRLLEAGLSQEAAAVLLRLLACGSRGRPWHRHDLVARLSALGLTHLSIQTTVLPCKIVEAAGLYRLLDR